MDFIDETLTKAKEVFDVACKKTSEVVNAGKQKYDIAAMENKLAKTYKELGIAAFKAFGETDEVPAEVKSLIVKVREEEKQINEAKAELLKAKNKRMCPSCGANISNDSAFCNHCGAKLIFTEGE